MAEIEGILYWYSLWVAETGMISQGNTTDEKIRLLSEGKFGNRPWGIRSPFAYSIDASLSCRESYSLK